MGLLTGSFCLNQVLAVVIDILPGAVFGVDNQGRVTIWNQAMEQMAGIPAGEIVGKSPSADGIPLEQDFFSVLDQYFKTFIHPDDRGKIMAHLSRVRGRGKARRGLEFRVKGSLGCWRWYLLRNSVLTGTDGQPLYYIWVAVDITSGKRVEQMLRESERRWKLALEGSEAGAWEYNIQTSEVNFSKKWKRMLGYRPGEIKNCLEDHLSLIHPDDVATALKVQAEYLDGKTPMANVQYRLRCKDGSYRWILSRGKISLRTADGKPLKMVGADIDIQEHKQVEERLKYLSFHDPLTGLYNRTYFEQEMHRLNKSRTTQVGIVVCDVDGLKLINDSLGHGKGDQLLVEAARIVRKSFRQEDIVARIGGDELAVLIPECNTDAARRAIGRIKNGVEGYNLNSPELHLSLSAGYAVRTLEESDLAGIFKQADDNMYRDKLNTSQSAHHAIVLTLKNALKEKDFISEGHANRMKVLMQVLAYSIGLTGEIMEDLLLLAEFHDIGKVAVPDKILQKKGYLTNEEKAEMQRHCEVGQRIALSSPDLAPIADWILKHHEWWNGRGYPLGLKGEEIPLECRLLTLADAYDSMTHDRPYRKAMTHKEAMTELKKGVGAQFDPQLVPRFMRIFQRNKSTGAN